MANRCFQKTFSVIVKKWKSSENSPTTLQNLFIQIPVCKFVNITMFNLVNRNSFFLFDFLMNKEEGVVKKKHIVIIIFILLFRKMITKKRRS